MKKITPLRRYDADREYPAVTAREVQAEAEAGRRSFLKGLLAGAAVVGAGMLAGAEAAAQPRPRPKPLPPGVPPRPTPGGGPPPRDKPPIPGGGPQPRPNPRPTARPCDAGPAQTVTLDALFAFCDERNGLVIVTTTDAQVAARLKRPGEGRRLAPIVKAVFARQRSCAWIAHPPSVAQVQAALARALTDAYQQRLGAELRPLQVRLDVKPQRVRLGGVMPMPRRRPPRRGGCASCSTDASLEDVLLPAGLVAAVLLATKVRVD